MRLRAILLRAALLAGLSPALSGCVVCWAVLNTDGSGTVELMYTAGVDATPESESALFRSPHVTLQSLAIAPDRKAVVRLAFDDIVQLSTVPWFHSATITRTPDRLRIVVTHDPVKVSEDGRPGPRLSIMLPGPIIEASGLAEISRNRVVWWFTQAEFLGESTTDLSVRYAAGAPPFLSERRGFLAPTLPGSRGIAR